MSDQSSNTPIQLSATSIPPIELWTPGFIAVVTFFLGFPAGIVLASINWFRMGLKNRAKIFLLGGVIGSVFLAVVTVFIPGNSDRIILFLVNIAVLYFLYSQVKADIEDLNAARVSLEKAGELGGCLIGLVTLGIYLALIFGALFFIGIILTSLGIPLPE